MVVDIGPFANDDMAASNQSLIYLPSNNGEHKIADEGHLPSDMEVSHF